MKFLTLFTLLTFFSLTVLAQGPLITEIHYDNNYDQYQPFGIDSIEYVEIYLPDPQPVDLTSWKIATYDAVSGSPTDAEVAFTRDLTDTLRTWDTPNGMYYVIEFVDSVFFTFPIGGIRDGEDGVALVQIGTPNIVHQFWRYETCTDFTALNGVAAGAISDPITTDFSRNCGSSGVFLVQMNSAQSTGWSIQQNGFGDWELDDNTATVPPLENDSNVPVDLTFFRASVDEDYTFLSWATAQEFDNDYFIVMHSMDGKNFEELGQIDGKGNYSGESRYDYRHYTQENGIHFYKIRQVDYDGKFEDFEVRSVEIDHQKDIQALPSSTQTDFQLTNISRGDLVTIFDTQGRQVIEQIYEDRMDISNLPNGIYVVHVNNQMIKINKF